jgi:cell division protein FtsB
MTEHATPGTPTALIQARLRDVGHRQQRVRQALADMTADGSEITISAVAARARVHRSFIHRHHDLHAAVLTAASQTLTNPSPASTAISHRSVLAENANLHAHNHRQAQHIRDLEDRLSDLLGQQAFERSGLGAATNTAALQAEIDKQRQTVLDLTRALEERDEELAAARETNRQLMTELNRISAVPHDTQRAD